MQHGRVRRAYLGIVSAPTPLPASLHERAGRKDGLRVAELVADGPAARAGLRAGDILVSAAGQPVTTAQDLQRLMFGEAIGKPAGDHRAAQRGPRRRDRRAVRTGRGVSRRVARQPTHRAHRAEMLRDT